MKALKQQLKNFEDVYYLLQRKKLVFLENVHHFTRVMHNKLNIKERNTLKLFQRYVSIKNLIIKEMNESTNE